MEEHHITRANAILRTISEHLYTQVNKVRNSYSKSSQLTQHQQSSRYTCIPEKGKNCTFSMFVFVNSHGMSGLFSGESMCYRKRQHTNLAESSSGGKTDQAKRRSGSESAHVVKRRGEGPGEVSRGGGGSGGGDLHGNFRRTGSED
jgi:hypothetical protein